MSLSTLIKKFTIRSIFQSKGEAYYYNVSSMIASAQFTKVLVARSRRKVKDSLVVVHVVVMVQFSIILWFHPLKKAKDLDDDDYD